MGPKRKYKVYDMVMAADHGKLYEAKILKIQTFGNGWKYFVHYNNWDRKYDAWVDESLLSGKQETKKVEKNKGKKQSTSSATDTTQDNENNDQDGLENDIVPIRRSNRRSSEPTTPAAEGSDPTTTTKSLQVNVSNKKTRKSVLPKIDLRPAASKQQVKLLAQSELCTEDSYDQKLVDKLNIPFQMKKFAVDEWNLIATTTSIPDRKLILLPRKHTVRDVICSYLLEKKKVMEREEYEDHVSFFEELRHYFDRALPTILLYRQERQQYDVVVNQMPGLPPCEIYGCEHFNRLFLKFYGLMYGIVFAPGDDAKVFSKLSDFFHFLVDEVDKYFVLGDYVLANQGMILVERPRIDYPSLEYKSREKTNKSIENIDNYESNPKKRSRKSAS